MFMAFSGRGPNLASRILLGLLNHDREPFDFAVRQVGIPSPSWTSLPAERDGRGRPGTCDFVLTRLVTPMSTEREKLVRDINGLKETVRLGWLQTAVKPMTPTERLELQKASTP
jgi:hypothetical protein